MKPDATENGRSELTQTVDDQANADAIPPEELFVVGIGASAGGLEALEAFFDHMPADTGMAFVVVQHLSPDFKSLMNELLARHTSMPIHRVQHGMPVEPNGIYLIPAKKNLTISHGKLLLSEQDVSGGLNLPIDFFFRSLAQDCGKRAIAVVLSGTGSDGSRGIRDVHDAQGLVVVQDRESAAFDGMPRSAIATDVADLIAEPTQMATLICEYHADPDSLSRGDDTLDGPIAPGAELTTVFRLFRSRYGIDFTLYRSNTIHRRLERRMKMARCEDLREYVMRLENDVAELDSLYRDMLVEVTQFFRDPAAFDRLRTEVIPDIVKQASGPRDEIRVWVPGCATGEEAYSIAILIDECARRLNQAPVIKVFATDAHRNSLEIASTGLYSQEALQDVPEELREFYFTKRGNLFQVSRDLRQMVIFAPHDITKDPPFTKLDLLSCRNVLIYIEPTVQKRVISLFHFGLKVDGVMVLGPSESVGELTREFDSVDRHWRIFRKLRDVRLPDAKSITLSPALTSVVQQTPEYPGVCQLRSGLSDTAVMEDLVDRYVPPSLLVNEHFELVHSFGDARKLLEQPKGRPTLEVLKMVQGDLRMALSAALHRASREEERVVLQGVRLQTEAGRRPMQVIVEPYKKGNQSLYLICLEMLRSPYPAPEPTAEAFNPDDQASQRIADLEHELQFAKESLQTTVEELESSNEEMQSTNEELVASNEELQSTNEELHSVNEELYTVNAEHQRKIEELTQLTSDMDNLLRSTEIGTIFLDRDLCIRKFTPAIASAYNLMEQDVGRPIEQFSYKMDNPDLLDSLRQVIATGKAVEREVSGGENKTFLKKIQPYRAANGEMDGVVITFTDVTSITRIEAEERQQRQHLERVTRDLQDFAYAVSHDLHAPLRHVADHIDRFEEAFDEELPPNAAGVVQEARNSTARLECILDCLLQYSRVNTRGRAFESADLNDVVSEVLENLGPEIAKTAATITCDPLPTISGDPSQLAAMFQHLVDNGIKYCADRAPALHISANYEHGAILLQFADNGIGIQTEQLQSIFVIFKRLGLKDTVAGNGLGLAISKRIVERHNGTIWAESFPGRGTNIFVRLPITQEPAVPDQSEAATLQEAAATESA